MKAVQQFIKANATAYATASKVFATIEGADFETTLAEAGITGNDVKVYATMYVAEKTGVNPHPSQRGDTLVFKKDTSEYNRVKYLVDVALGVKEARKAKKQATSHARLTAEARKAAKAYLAQFDTLADAIAALKTVA